MSKIEREKIDLALYVIELKKAQIIKNNSEKTYIGLKRKIEELTKDKEEIYKGNEEIINKVLNKYLEEVKK